LARIARFYHLNPWELTATQRRTLLEHISGLWAEEVLRERGSSLSADSAKSLTLLATGDRKEADKAWLQAKQREVFGER